MLIVTFMPLMLSVVMLNAVMLSVVMLSLIMLSLIMLTVTYAECLIYAPYAECP